MALLTGKALDPPRAEAGIQPVQEKILCRMRAADSFESEIPVGIRGLLSTLAAGVSLRGTGRRGVRDHGVPSDPQAGVAQEAYSPGPIARNGPHQESES